MDGMKPLVEEESHFLDSQEDLAPLCGQDRGSGILEKYLEQYGSRFFATKVFISLPFSLRSN